MQFRTILISNPVFKGGRLEARNGRCRSASYVELSCAIRTISPPSGDIEPPRRAANTGYGLVQIAITYVIAVFHPERRKRVALGYGERGKLLVTMLSVDEIGEKEEIEPPQSQDSLEYASLVASRCGSRRTKESLSSPKVEGSQKGKAK